MGLANAFGSAMQTDDRMRKPPVDQRVEKARNARIAWVETA
jgi:hypothetical protein